MSYQEHEFYAHSGSGFTMPAVPAEPDPLMAVHVLMLDGAITGQAVVVAHGVDEAEEIALRILPEGAWVRGHYSLDPHWAASPSVVHYQWKIAGAGD